jgi:hypothetical protein
LHESLLYIFSNYEPHCPSAVVNDRRHSPAPVADNDRAVGNLAIGGGWKIRFDLLLWSCFQLSASPSRILASLSARASDPTAAAAEKAQAFEPVVRRPGRRRHVGGGLAIRNVACRRVGGQISSGSEENIFWRRPVEDRATFAPFGRSGATMAEDLDTFEETYAMAKLHPRLTGLPMAVWITPNEGFSHDVRVEVSRDPRRPWALARRHFGRSAAATGRDRAGQSDHGRFRGRRPLDRSQLGGDRRLTGAARSTSTRSSSVWPACHDTKIPSRDGKGLYRAGLVE